MFQARFSAVYTPEGGDPLRLIDAHRTWMTSEAESEWDLPMDEREFCSADYKEFVPTGNASKSFSWEWFVQYLSVAQLESNLRRLELSLALARTGKLELREAWHNRRPTCVTTWRAVIASLNVRFLREDEEDVVPYNQFLDPLLGKALGSISLTRECSAPELQIT